MSIRVLLDEKKEGISNKDLFLLYKNNKDIEIRNEIVQRYLYVADILVKKYINRGIEYDDLYQVASLALIKAVERFDIDKGFEFSSFATPTILGEIKKYFRDKGWAIRVPRRIQELSQKLQGAKEKLTQDLHRAPMVRELAEYLDSSEEDILQAMEASTVFEIQSINQSYENENNEKDLRLEEALGIKDKNFTTIENQDFINTILKAFSTVEIEIFKMRFLEEKTQGEIAKQLEVSQMTISRMEKKIINKFREELAQVEKK